jgi:hypothetical protein
MSIAFKRIALLAIGLLIFGTVPARSDAPHPVEYGKGSSQAA